MQIMSQTIKQAFDRDREYIEIGFEDDYIVKDSKPDVEGIICSQGQVKVEELKRTADSMWLSGTVEFEILCASSSALGVEQIKDVIPFTEKLPLQDIEEDARVYVHLAELVVGIINSRKLEIRGLLGVEILPGSIVDTVISNDASGDGLQTLVEETRLLALKHRIKDILRAQREFELPKSKPNIRRILYSQVALCGVDSAINSDKLEISGELAVSVIYLSEEENVEYYESTASLLENVKLSETAEECLLWTRAGLTQYAVSAEGDYDGEMRQIKVDISINVDAKLWEEKCIPMLRDMYSLRGDVQPNYTSLKAQRLLMKNISKLRLMQTSSRVDSRASALMACGGNAQVEIDAVEYAKDGVTVKGHVHVKGLILTGDDACPIESLSDSVEFKQWIEVPEVGADTYCEVCGMVDQVQLSLLDATDYEIRCVIGISLIAIGQSGCDMVSGYEEQSCTSKGASDEPGIVGYIVKENEPLWNIAKENRTTIEDILENNATSLDRIRPGDKIIIAKRAVL